MQQIFSRLFSAALVSASLAFAGYAIGHGILGNRTADRFVSVKGLAEKDVVADIGTWELTYMVSGDALEETMARLESQQQTIIALLKENGLESANITVRGVNVTDNKANSYNDNAATMPHYTVNSTIAVRSTNVQTIKAIAQRQAEMVKKGIIVTSAATPYYAFTKLNDVKPAMLADAIKNARQAADQFAKESGATLGTIRTAQQGQFSILARDDASSESENIEKKVRVVSTVEYALER
jgi:uncharacterized protein